MNVKYKITMNEVKLSTKNQIVIPREARAALGVKAGDRLLVVVRGETVVLLPKPKKYAKAIAGIGKGLYLKDHLSTERENWEGRDGHFSSAVK